MMQLKNSDKLGLIRPEQAMGGSAQLAALFRHLTGKMQTITLVEVVAVQNDGINPVGTVSVKPLVSQLDGSDNIIEHGVIGNIPYFRLQGGQNAVVIDPQKGDIALCSFCSRDISAVKRTRKPSPPNSRRQFDWSDGLYLGGYLNGSPTQYIQFNPEGGINIVSTGDININGLKISKDGVLTLSNGVIVDTHVHGGVRSGDSDTREPK
ncbi:Gp138 family membrane-puncturing spike protein [Acinetobacter stercoris]|nr:Gp138 family membrane-puncturing spike protein [Acinetobacter stercoris]